jgi:hypothetical protein
MTETPRFSLQSERVYHVGVTPKERRAIARTAALARWADRQASTPLVCGSKSQKTQGRPRETGVD